MKPGETTLSEMILGKTPLPEMILKKNNTFAWEDISKNTFVGYDTWKNTFDGDDTRKKKLCENYTRTIHKKYMATFRMSENNDGQIYGEQLMDV